MKSCKQCNAQLNDSDTLCGICGTKCETVEFNLREISDSANPFGASNIGPQHYRDGVADGFVRRYGPLLLTAAGLIIMWEIWFFLGFLFIVMGLTYSFRNMRLKHGLFFKVSFGICALCFLVAVGLLVLL